MANYSKATILESQIELLAWLDKHGSATQATIARGLHWPITKLKEVLYSHPEWLIASGSIKTPFGGVSTLYHCRGVHQLGWCPKCEMKNFHPSFVGIPCLRCSRGDKPKPSLTQCVSSLDGSQATDARPGSPEKIEILSARYEQGIDLWNNNDSDWSLPDDFQWVGLVQPQEEPDEDD